MSAIWDIGDSIFAYCLLMSANAISLLDGISLPARLPVAFPLLLHRMITRMRSGRRSGHCKDCIWWSFNSRLTDSMSNSDLSSDRHYSVHLILWKKWQEGEEPFVLLRSHPLLHHHVTQWVRGMDERLMPKKIIMMTGCEEDVRQTERQNGW